MMRNPLRPLGRWFNSPRAQRLPIQRSANPLQLERLEGREVPANLVQLQLTGTTLNITAIDDLTPDAVLNGDNDNAVQIVGGANAGEFTVSAGGGTEFRVFNPATKKFDLITTDDQLFSNVRDIKIDLKQGHDQVIVTNAQLSGALTFIGGGDDDSLYIGSPNPLDAPTIQTFGSISVTNGDGDDLFAIGNGQVVVAKTITVKNGLGDSLVHLNTMETDKLTVGGLSITNADGFDDLIVGGEQFVSTGVVSIVNGSGGSRTVFAAFDTQFNGGVTISNGDGFDEVVLGFVDSSGVDPLVGSVFAKSITIANKSGGSAVLLPATTTLGGKLSVTSTDGRDEFIASTILPQNLGGGKFAAVAVAIDTGNGGSLTMFDGESTQLASLSVKNAAGFDSTLLNGNDMTITGGVTIVNGNGGSDVQLNVGGTLKIGGALSITNLAGDDQVALGNSDLVSIGSIAISNGTGPSQLGVTATEVNVTGAVAFTSTDGEDLVTIDSDIFTTTKGGVTVKTGNGPLTMAVRSLTFNVGGTVAIENGAGIQTVDYGQIGSELSSLGLTFKNGHGDVSILMDGYVTIGTAKTAGMLSLTGGEGFENFVAFGDVTVNGSVTFNNGHGGSDVQFQGVTLITKTLTVTSLDGIDRFTVSGPSFEARGDVKISSGHGEADIESLVSFSAFENVFLGKVTVTALSGQDGVVFENLTTGRAVSLSLGSDTANVSFGIGGITNLTSLDIVTGDGNDLISVVAHEITVTGATKVTTGTGDDIVQWFGSPSIFGGAVTVSTGDGLDFVFIDNWTVGGETKIDTGALNDVLEIDDSTFNGNVTITTGTGHDTVNIEANDTGVHSTFAAGKKVLIRLDSGSDTLTIGQAEVGVPEDDFAQFLGSVTIDGGAGLDLAFVLPTSAGGVRANTFIAKSPVFIGVEAPG